MRYAKTIVAGLAAVLAAIVPGLTDGPMSLAEWLNVAVLAAGAVQVWNAANIPGYRFAKAVSAVVTAGGVVLIAALSDGAIAGAEWVQVIIAVLTPVGVVATPNAGTRPAAA